MRLGRAKTPATPQPTAVKIEHPAPEPQSSEPLSIPQTQVELPRPQAIDPQALATPPVYTPAETASQHPVHRPAKRPALGQPNTPVSCDRVIGRRKDNFSFRTEEHQFIGIGRRLRAGIGRQIETT